MGKYRPKIRPHKVKTHCSLLKTEYQTDEEPITSI